MNSKANILSDVVVIRSILIVLLVFYHAFAIFGGAWAPIKDYPDIPMYWWLDKLSYAFMLELFVFVSGYVFGYQVRIKGESKLQAKSLFWGKFKRLMIPCMVFSLLYILSFQDIKQPLHKTVSELINGTGHMWFLPMLYWCFVGIWLIEKLHFNSKRAVPLLVLAALCSFLPLPIRMGLAMYYMLFFFMGYIIQRNAISLDCLYTKRSALITTISFAVIFPLLTLLKVNLGVILMGGGDNQLVIKAINGMLQHFLQMIYSSVGILMILSLVGLVLKKHAVPQWMNKVGVLSFGVYLFQQFILMGIYDHTNLPYLLGCYLLPWFGFTFTLVVSIVIAKLFNNTRIGRLLIG